LTGKIKYRLTLNRYIPPAPVTFTFALQPFNSCKSSKLKKKTKKSA